MPPRTSPALVPRAHETSIFLYWRASSLLSSAPFLWASLLSSPLALRRRAGRSFGRFLRKGLIWFLDDRGAVSAHLLRAARMVSWEKYGFSEAMARQSRQRALAL